MDLLSDQPEVQVDGIYLNAPEGDDSDGYDDSDTEEGQADFLSRNLLKVSFKNLNKFFFVLCIFIYKLPTYFFFIFFTDYRGRSCHIRDRAVEPGGVR